MENIVFMIVRCLEPEPGMLALWTECLPTSAPWPIQIKFSLQNYWSLRPRKVCYFMHAEHNAAITYPPPHPHHHFHNFKTQVLSFYFCCLSILHLSTNYIPLLSVFPFRYHCRICLLLTFYDFYLQNVTISYSYFRCRIHCCILYFWNFTIISYSYLSCIINNCILYFLEASNTIWKMIFYLLFLSSIVQLHKIKWRNQWHGCHYCLGENVGLRIIFTREFEHVLICFLIINEHIIIVLICNLPRPHIGGKTHAGTP